MNRINRSTNIDPVLIFSAFEPGCFEGGVLYKNNIFSHYDEHAADFIHSIKAMLQAKRSINAGQKVRLTFPHLHYFNSLRIVYS